MSPISRGPVPRLASSRHVNKVSIYLSTSLRFTSSRFLLAHVLQVHVLIVQSIPFESGPVITASSRRRFAKGSLSISVVGSVPSRDFLELFEDV